MRSRIEDAIVQDAIHISGLRAGRTEVIPATGFVVTKDMPPILQMTPAGAVNVLLPASDETTKGLLFFITNIGAGGIITLQSSGGAGFAAAITIAVSGGWVLVQCTGSATANLGWKIVASNLP